VQAEAHPQPQPEQPPESGWYWCPQHLLAAEHPGACAVCGQPYQAAPITGIPAGPYRPTQKGIRKTKRERVAVAAGLAAAFAVIGGIVAGVVLLYRQGTPLDSLGQPVQQTAASGQPSSSSSADSNNGTTPILLHTLENKTITLNGVWSATRSVITPMSEIAGIFATGTAKPPLDIAARHNKTVIAAFTVTTSTPDSDVSSLVGPSGGTRSTTDGGSYTFSDGQSMTIAGHTSVAIDYQRKSAAGKLLVQVHFYVVSAVDHLEIIEIGTTDTSTSDLSAAEHAVESI
jgi:hypothetical protein